MSFPKKKKRGDIDENQLRCRRSRVHRQRHDTWFVTPGQWSWAYTDKVTIRAHPVGKDVFWIGYLAGAL
jgi:hypothetical protein